MSIVTKKDFKRIHNNGSVLIEVPSGTKITIKPFYGAMFWTVEASQPVSKDGKNTFRVNSKEYSQLIGA